MSPVSVTASLIGAVVFPGLIRVPRTATLRPTIVIFVVTGAVVAAFITIATNMLAIATMIRSAR